MRRVPRAAAASLTLIALAAPAAAHATMTFAHSISPTGKFDDGITAGDFNHDGVIDLAAANDGANNVTILTGAGDGTFTATTTPPTGFSPYALVTGDFNNDGRLDLATSNIGANTVTIL